MPMIVIPDERRTVSVYLQELDPTYPAQMREHMDSRVVEEYAETMQCGTDFPMPVLVTGPNGMIPVDGHHRIEAMRRNGRDQFTAQVITTPEDVNAIEFARLLALRFNNQHGVRKTRQDRRKEALTTIPLLLRLGMSNREMAHELSVDEKTVRNLRKEFGMTQPAVRDDKLAHAVIHDFTEQDSSEVEAIANQPEPQRLDGEAERPELPVIPRNLSKELQVRVRNSRDHLGIGETDAINLLMATASLLARMEPSDACAVANVLYSLHTRAAA